MVSELMIQPEERHKCTGWQWKPAYVSHQIKKAKDTESFACCHKPYETLHLHTQTTVFYPLSTPPYALIGPKQAALMAGIDFFYRHCGIWVGNEKKQNSGWLTIAPETVHKHVWFCYSVALCCGLMIRFLTISNAHRRSDLRSNL